MFFINCRYPSWGGFFLLPGLAYSAGNISGISGFAGAAEVYEMRGIRVLYGPAGGVVKLARLRVRQVVSGDGRGGCVKHSGSGEGHGDLFEHGTYLHLDRYCFIGVIFLAPLGMIYMIWYNGGEEGGFILEQEKQSFIINIQCVTGTGLLYQDIKHIIKCLVKLIGHLIWSVLSTIWLCYSEWWDSLHTQYKQ